MPNLYIVLGCISTLAVLILLAIRYGSKSKENKDNEDELDAIAQHKKNDEKVDTLTDAEQLEYAKSGVYPKR